MHRRSRCPGIRSNLRQCSAGTALSHEQLVRSEILDFVSGDDAAERPCGGRRRLRGRFRSGGAVWRLSLYAGLVVRPDAGRLPALRRPGAWDRSAGRDELAGGSPALVIAGEPGSRPQASGEILPSERGVESPDGGRTVAGRGAKLRAQGQANLAAPRQKPPKGRGGPSRSCRGEGNRLRSEVRSGAGHPRGMEERTQRQLVTEQERPSPAAHVERRRRLQAECEMAPCRKGVRGAHSTDDAR